jgi:hypothetical protein
VAAGAVKRYGGRIEEFASQLSKDDIPIEMFCGVSHGSLARTELYRLLRNNNNYKDL